MFAAHRPSNTKLLIKTPENVNFLPIEPILFIITWFLGELIKTE